MANPRHRLRGSAVLAVLYLALIPCICATRRMLQVNGPTLIWQPQYCRQQESTDIACLLQDPGWPTFLPEQAVVKDAASQFPMFQLPATISNLAGSLPKVALHHTPAGGGPATICRC